MQQPLVSIILLTYNQEKYIEEALRGVFNQSYANTEIIISDDHSIDKTPLIIERFLRENSDKGNVFYNHNEENLGLVKNFNKAVACARGDFFVLAAGDDVSLKDRVAISLEKIQNLGVDSLAMNFQYVNSDGNELEQKGYSGNDKELIYVLNDYIENKPRFPMGPSRIFSKRVFDVFGMLDDDCQTEDTTLTFRSILLGGIAMIDEVGVLYRWHGNNISSYESLMTRINPKLIYKQYRKDLKTAYRKDLISRMQYFRIWRILLDYKSVQLFMRNLYSTKNPMGRHIYGLLFLINPLVLRSHKSAQWLKNICPELFLVKNKIKSLVK
ncbi:MAG: glycosyltransferase [Bacteroidales bacterium]|nr:glycosyltransferase [Bacteroidales bacterium]